MKEQRFEKVVEYDFDNKFYMLYFWLMLGYNLFIGFTTKSLGVVMFFDVVFLIIGVVGLIESRKVYWRKI